MLSMTWDIVSQNSFFRILKLLSQA